ncbi:unnamed protein product [Phytophthora fragariaefolia]|uniref:Unnamed protein product n=1 Tax=Phytophthora fragariaefolia TaxID=1490495 RepID=A0A9W7CIN4_9STRA|nr:unnamed protein product [Phytophthora fragariaefolia]
METDNGFDWTSVRVVCRQWPRVGDLPHAAELIDVYIGNLSLEALPNVVKQGNITFQQFSWILNAVDQSVTLVHHEKLRQYRKAMYLVPSNMAVEEGAVEAMQQLYARNLDCVDATVIEAVCKLADLSMMKWLQKCDPFLFSKFDWSKQCLFNNASAEGRVDVVRWLVNLLPIHI